MDQSRSGNTCLDRAVPDQHAATRTETWAGLVLALVLTILVGVPPSPARADGDPASDVLVSQSLFVPADAATPMPEQLRLVSLLDAARQAGLPIRVAIISNPSDLGAVSELWDQPRAYARFIGLELSLAGRARLLVVMPSGVGFYWPGHSAPAIYELVDRIPVDRRGSALARAAQAAVMSVANAAHVRLDPPGRAAGAPARAPTAWRPTTDRVFGLAILAALAAVGFAVYLAFTRGRPAFPTLTPRTRRRLPSAPVRPEPPYGGSPPPEHTPRRPPLPPVTDAPAPQPQPGPPSSRRRRTQ
jgi:hypothetical protein